MAELNFGLLTPPGSQSIGNAFVQGMDQAAVARAQENQNALAQYTLGKAKREDELTNKMLAGLQGATTIEQQAAVLRSVGKVKEASDLMNSDLERRYKLGQIETNTAKLPGEQARAFQDVLKPYSSAAYNSQNVDEGVANVRAMYANPTLAAVLTKIKPLEQAIADTTAAFGDPKTTDQWRQHWGGITPEKLFESAQRPGKTVDTDMGGYISTQRFDARGNPIGEPTLRAKTSGPGTVPANILANVAVAGAQDRGEIVSGAAPAQAGTPVTPAAFPRITPQVQTQRNNEQIVLLNAELQKPENNNPVTQQALRAEIAKLSTGNPFAASGGDPLRPATVVNNMPGAAAAAPGAYSPKMLRDMALKGMQPDGKGGQTFIPGGEKDPVVKQQVSTAQAVGAQIGKNNAVALEKLPNAITTGKELIRKLDEILGDANVVRGEIMYNTAPAKGFDSAFGPTGIIARAYPSSEAAGFQARVKEILGGAFLEAYETLRGAQGITDIEGKKATEARTRMGFDLSKTEFITAAREYRKTAAEALARSETRLKSLQGSAAPSLDAIFNTQRPR